MSDKMTDQGAVNTIDEALEALKNGQIIVVVDDEDRENEGDFIIAAEKVTPEAVNFIAKFYIDEFSTDLALEAKDYDTSYSAGYESWMLLESSEQPTAIDGRWAHVRSRL